jgi:putative RNA 2'-phosphotransferase
MTDKDKISLSKFLSLILRHRPEKAGITLDGNGWADVDELIEGANKTGRVAITLDDIMEVVSTNDKQRFAFNNDYTKIRANQGHSVSVDVELTEMQPPNILYHGTSTKSLQGIMANGIRPKSRLYVHLSEDVETAGRVGKRHGTPIILSIDAGKMNKEGVTFYLSANGVWLTKCVPVAYINQSQYTAEPNGATQ